MRYYVVVKVSGTLNSSNIRGRTITLVREYPWAEGQGLVLVVKNQLEVCWHEINSSRQLDQVHFQS